MTLKVAYAPEYVYQRHFLGTHRRYLTPQAIIYSLHVRRSCWMWATSSEQGKVFSRTQQAWWECLWADDYRNQESEHKKSKGQENGTPPLGSVTRQEAELGWVTRERLRQVRPLGMPLKATGIGINQNPAAHRLRWQCLRQTTQKRGWNQKG